MPGGKRDPEDADDVAAAVRETREEIGVDLTTAIYAGNLPERIVATTWGKVPLMVLCPFVFVLPSSKPPVLLPQPTEVASVHWIPLRALLSPSLRTLEKVDISSRMAQQGGPLVRSFLRAMMGKMTFSAISLVPSESTYASSIAGFVPEEKPKALDWVPGQYGVAESSQNLAHQQPLLLWGLTLGVLADFLDMLPPYNAVALWVYPTFTVPDLRFLVWVFTRNLRKSNAGDLSSGTWPSNTAADSQTQAVTVTADEPTRLVNQQHDEREKNTVGISGLGVGSRTNDALSRLLVGYYDRINVALAVFFAYRIASGTAAAVWLYRLWKRRQAGRL